MKDQEDQEEGRKGHHFEAVISSLSISIGISKINVL